MGHRGRCETGMVAGPEAELVLQRGGVLGRGGFLCAVSSFIFDGYTCGVMDADLDLVWGRGARGEGLVVLGFVCSCCLVY